MLSVAHLEMTTKILGPPSTFPSRVTSVACKIYINNYKPLFEFLRSRQSLIEQQVGAKLEWIEAKQARRIVQRKANTGLLPYRRPIVQSR
jgi:hypothetical protein